MSRFEKVKIWLKMTQEVTKMAIKNVDALYCIVLYCVGKLIWQIQTVHAIYLWLMI